MPAITASRTCAVQMLLVAFSRRMCCSRVCSAMRSATCAVHVLRDTDQATRKLAHVVGARREVGRVGAAISQRHAETLRASDRDVGAELARGRQHRQRQQVGGHHRQRAVLVNPLDERAVVVKRPVGGGILNQRAEDLAVKAALLDLTR